VHSEKKFKLRIFLERNRFTFICNIFQKNKKSGKLRQLMKMVKKNKEPMHSEKNLEHRYKKNCHGKGCKFHL
jgi:hypothetical protein